jgi:hypothetical protein
MKLFLFVSFLICLSIAYCEVISNIENEIDYHVFELGHLESEFADLSSLSTDNRALVNMESHLSPLYAGYGTHYTYVYVGTPPQKQTLIVDTARYY